MHIIILFFWNLHLLVFVFVYGATVEVYTFEDFWFRPRESNSQDSREYREIGIDIVNDSAERE
jgi:hypothetical protein